MYNFNKVRLAIPAYNGAIDDSKEAVKEGSGSCLAFAGNLGAQAKILTQEDPLLVRVSTKKHISGDVSSHFMAVDPYKKMVCDMLAAGPRSMSLVDLKKPYTDYQNARDRLLRVAIATHLREDEDPFVGEEIVEDGLTGYKSTVRVVRIELTSMLALTSPGSTPESLVEELERAVL